MTNSENQNEKTKVPNSQDQDKKELKPFFAPAQEEESKPVPTKEELEEKFKACQKHSKLLRSKPTRLKVSTATSYACPMCMLVFTRSGERLSIRSVNADFLERNFA